MFVMVKKLVVEWPVEVNVPQHGGTVEKQEFTALIEILDKEEADKLIRTNQSDDTFCERILAGWTGGVVDEGENPIAFTPESKRELLSKTYVQAGLMGAYFKAAAGVPAKNSKAPGDDGSGAESKPAEAPTQ